MLPLLCFLLFVLPVQTCALHKCSPGTPPPRPPPQQPSTSQSSNDEPIHDNHQKVPAADTRQQAVRIHAHQLAQKTASTRTTSGRSKRVSASHSPAEHPTGNQHWPVQHGASNENFVEVVGALVVGGSPQLGQGQGELALLGVSPSHQLVHTHLNLRRHRIVDGRVPPELKSTGGRREPD